MKPDHRCTFECLDCRLNALQAKIMNDSEDFIKSFCKGRSKIYQVGLRNVLWCNLLDFKIEAKKEIIKSHQMVKEEIRKNILEKMKP